MRASYNWLREITGLDPGAAVLAERLTFAGLEVEGLTHVGAALDRVVVGVVLEKAPHPSKSNLSVARVSAGHETLQVVCGAPNCPGPGSRVALALPGAVIGGVTITSRELAGVASSGMICSEAELDIGTDHSGVILLDGVTEAAPGTPLATALGLEDWILEIGITPNRPDALCHRGLGRDVAVLFDAPFAPPGPTFEPQLGAPVSAMAAVELHASEACPRYGAAVVTGLRVGPSPFALRYRLHTLGLRPISNLVDITNRILLEWGQPLHAFDLDTLEGQRIVVRLARDGERMKTLDDIERVFTADDLLICDGSGPVAVAGVMGGLATGITAATRNVLIECAYFRPQSIRRTSKRLKLSSDSSYRFERGIDPLMGPQVLGVATAMMAELGSGVVATGLIDCYPRPIPKMSVSLRPQRLRRVMGFEVPGPRIAQILRGLGCEVSDTGTAIAAVVPSARPDIEREIDLIEEVARIHGMHHVPETLPSLRCTVPRRSEYEATQRSREILVATGLQEAINYSFVPDELHEAFGVGSGVVHIANPLSLERRAMRTTLLAGLVENLRRAENRFLAGLKQFELGRTFHDDGELQPREVLRAAGLLAGPAEVFVGEAARSLDFYDAKGVVEAYVDELAGRRPTFAATAEISCLHPRRACRVVLDDTVVGLVGELHPKLLKRCKLAQGALGFELDVMALWHLRRRPRAEALPEFPPSVRDVALLVDEAVDAGPVAEALHAAGGPLAEAVRLFDIYRGKGILAGKKSLAFSVVYRAADHTLTDAEVDGAHSSAVSMVSELFGASRR